MLFVILAVALCGVAQAQPEPWVHPDGSIHYYHALSASGGINWNFAWDSALGHGGYLATVSSQAENDFVFSLVDSGIYWYERPGTGRLAGPWLGGTQDFGSHEPDSGWRWVTDETMEFRNWSPGQPDNAGDEDALHFGELVSGRVPTWNDLSSLDDSIRGFVRELSADSTTVGLTRRDSGASRGYTLFAPISSPLTYLVDTKGRLVRSWSSQYRPAFSCYLLENGNMLRTGRDFYSQFPGGGVGGIIEEFNWDDSLTWSYEYSTAMYCQHHDIEPMPNGHILLIAWELKTRAEAVAAGRNPDLLPLDVLWPDHLVEVDQATDNIVWEWHLWDHLIQDFDSTKANYGIVANHPELVDLNFVPAGERALPDWNHTNSVYYNEQLDQIVLSVHRFSEIWVIDHGTTTEQARGHTGGRQGMGGDILYRWGNPQTYRAGTGADQVFFGQHDARWIEPGLPGAGHVMVFNNGYLRPDSNYSTIDEFVPAADSTGRYPRPAPGTPFGPEALFWQYRADPPDSFFAAEMSGAHRLPNGNTLICNTIDGTLTEVTPEAQVVWRYVNPVIASEPVYQGDSAPANGTFRGTQYQSAYPGLAGRDLTPGYPLERYRAPFPGISDSGSSPPAAAVLRAGPNPFGRQARISFGPRHAGNAGADIFAADGRLVRTLTIVGGSAEWNGTDNRGKPVGRGVYCCRLRDADSGAVLKLVKLD